jgi:preprotein translocase subunit SecG
MTTVLIVIHLMVVLAMIGLVLLQRSEGGALGVGGGSNSFMTGRGAGNVLTRSTAVLAAVFFVTSIGLTLLARIETRPGDILNRLPGAPAETGAPAPAAPLGTPSSASDLLNQLGGTAPGPQTAPAAPGAPAVPAPAAPAAPAPAAPAPAVPAPEAAAPAPQAAPAAATPAPAAEAPAPAAEAPAPAPAAPASPPASSSP